MDGRVAKLFPGGRVALDLGCGDGSAFAEVRCRYAACIGLDIAAQPGARCGSRLGGWSFMLSNLNQGIPLAAGSVDAVFANQVIEHIGNPLQFAQEVHRVLRPAGVFVATTPNIQFLAHFWAIFVRGVGPMTSGERKRTAAVWDDGHIHYFTIADLDWIAGAAGFRHRHTRALIAERGRLQPLRAIFDRAAGTPLVKRLLSGNAMLVATK